MAKAIWNGGVLAESGQTIVVEGNHYFPPNAINRAYFKASDSHTTCHWKGVASYYDVLVDGQVNKDAAWYYPTPNDAAKQIAGYVAFMSCAARCSRAPRNARASSRVAHLRCAARRRRATRDMDAHGVQVKT